MKKFVLLISCLLTVTKGFAGVYTDPTIQNSTCKLGSKFYFPNSIGLNVPFKNDETNIKDGIAVNVAVEYRPEYMNAFFYKVGLDILNNNYLSDVRKLPTNIIQGKLSSDFILAGFGYRRQLNRWAIYAELLPGMDIRSFDRATINDDNVLISKITNHYFAVKTGLGGRVLPQAAF